MGHHHVVHAGLEQCTVGRSSSSSSLLCRLRLSTSPVSVAFAQVCGLYPADIQQFPSAQWAAAASQARRGLILIPLTALVASNPHLTPSWRSRQVEAQTGLVQQASSAGDGGEGSAKSPLCHCHGEREQPCSPERKAKAVRYERCRGSSRQRETRWRSAELVATPECVHQQCSDVFYEGGRDKEKKMHAKVLSGCVYTYIYIKI